MLIQTWINNETCNQVNSSSQMSLLCCRKGCYKRSSLSARTLNFVPCHCLTWASTHTLSLVTATTCLYCLPYLQVTPLICCHYLCISVNTCLPHQMLTSIWLTLIPCLISSSSSCSLSQFARLCHIWYSTISFSITQMASRTTTLYYTHS